MQVDNVKVAVALAYAFLAERVYSEKSMKIFRYYKELGDEHFSRVYMDSAFREAASVSGELASKFRHICEMCSLLENFQESLRAVLKSACRYSKRVHRDERKIAIHAAHRFLDTYTF